MPKNVWLAFLLGTISCATPVGKFTTLKDYLSKKNQNKIEKKPTQTAPQNTATNETLENKIDRLIDKIDQMDKQLREAEIREAEKAKRHQEHDTTFTKLWFIVANHKRAGDIYSGISASVANVDRFFQFGLMFSVSDQHTTSYSRDRLSTPIGLMAEIKTEHMVKNFIIMPNLTIPAARFELPMRYCTPRIEARTGIGYDWYLSYTDGEHGISLFESKKKKFTLPSGLSDDGYFSSVSSIDLDIKPLHMEANLILNNRQIKTALGIGVIW